MLKFIQQVVYEATGKKNLTYDTDFVKDLALNSFDIMNIVSMFEDRLGLEIPTRDVWKMHRVQDVIDYLEKRGCRKP